MDSRNATPTTRTLPWRMPRFPSDSAAAAYDEGLAAARAGEAKCRCPYDRDRQAIAGWWDIGYDVGALELSARAVA